MVERKLVDVAHVSGRSGSYRITIPKRVSEILKISEGDIIAFYEDGKIFIEKLQ
ncbi:MAG: AbrB/MazE/SpoVT family DNA-binding domain-containing protein [Candidatus Thermoplasmatota archaeon]|nr:AbrB/MazE/SpoVT family DNA-binding domain-containing protein [Candidatus Thermoplasmatota archaeon]MCL5786240.1 AbrB/MazE/SpoVT family DNA-binding domain-containing protein [Candidatus Thermoplasmatota archaeon]